MDLTGLEYMEQVFYGKYCNSGGYVIAEQKVETRTGVVMKKFHNGGF